MLSQFRLNVSRLRKAFSAFASFAVLLLLFNLPALAAAGDLDASFGQDGVTADPEFPGNIPGGPSATAASALLP